jgi:hypothetical protein
LPFPSENLGVMALGDVIGVLDVVRAAMKTIPVIGGQLEGGVEALLLICKHAEVSCSTVAVLPADQSRVQTVRSNAEDAKELAQQAAVMYVSIGKAIDPSQAKDVLQGKQSDLAIVIKFELTLKAASCKLNVAVGS